MKKHKGSKILPLKKVETNVAAQTEGINVKLDLGDVTYEQGLFLLRTAYSRIVGALTAFCEGPLAIRDGLLNMFYTFMLAQIRSILEQKGFEKLKASFPELPESLIGNIEDFDIWWIDGGMKGQAYEFLAEVEKRFILSGAKSFELHENLTKFYERMEQIIEYHDMQKKNIFDEMLSSNKTSPVPNKETFVFEADLSNKFALWTKANKDKIWNMKKKSDGQFSVSGEHMFNLLQNIGKPLIEREEKNNIIKTISKKLDIPSSKVESIFFNKDGKWGIRKSA